MSCFSENTEKSLQSIPGQSKEGNQSEGVQNLLDSNQSIFCLSMLTLRIYYWSNYF